MFKKLFNRITTPVLPATTPPFNTSTGAYTINIPASTTIPQNYAYSMNSVVGGVGAGNITVGNITGAAQASSGWPTINTTSGSGIIGGSIFTMTLPNNIVIFSKPSNNQEIVRLNIDGSVTWASEIDIDAAAEAFGQSLQMGAEMKAGISKSVKLRMRDSVFEDLIGIAKEKGSLTAEDLTYMLEASKIVEKLKGGYE